MSHLEREELLRWRDSGAAEERERVLSHLAACSKCAQVYAELIRTAPLEPTAQIFNPADFVTRGYGARKARGSTGRARISWLASWKLWAGALATAVVVVAAMLGTGTRWRPDVDITRGSGIRLITPLGPAPASSAPSALEWSSGVAAPVFRLELSESDGEVFYRIETKEPRVTLPPDVRAKLVAGHSYQYKITALDLEGQAVTGRSGTFAIADAKP